ncbi:MAG: aminoglycoside phosphotransferase family protein [Ornithinimicrobium sp.]
MAPQRRPTADVSIDTALVTALVAQQHPDLAALQVTHAAGGWDNEVFRLGREYAVRIPRRRMAAALIEHELTWLPQLARRLPLPIPAPIRRGAPGCGYPWAWSITRWLPGQTLASQPVDDVKALARDLGGFVAAMGVPAAPKAPRNPFRGVPLRQRNARVTSGINSLTDPEQHGRARSVWAAALSAPEYVESPVWLHGDLHPANLITLEGQLSAVIDFGDLTCGDPATDLSVAWMLFDAADRARFREAAGGCDDTTWRRAQGNALAHALACLSASDDDPVIGAIGRRTLTIVLTG